MIFASWQFPREYRNESFTVLKLNMILENLENINKDGPGWRFDQGWEVYRLYNCTIKSVFVPGTTEH